MTDTEVLFHSCFNWYSGIPPESEKLPDEKGAFALVFHKKEIRFSGVLSELENTR